MLSAASSRSSGTRRRQLGQPADHLHPRHRPRDGPVNEVTTEGQPRLWVRDLPPVLEQRRAGDHAAAHLLRRAADNHYVVVGARQPEFDYPRRQRGRRRTDDRVDRHDRHHAGLDADPAAVLAPVPRPRPADLRPDHRPTASCCSTGRWRSGWGDRAVPALRQGPVPRRRDDGRLMYVQDAYTISDQFPHATGFDTRRARRTSGCGGEAQLHPQQRQDHDGRLRRDDALLRRRPDRPDHPRVAGCLPGAVRAAVEHAGRARSPPPGPRGAVQRPDADVRAVPRHRAAHASSKHRPLDGPRRPDNEQTPAVRGLLRGDADAGRAEGRVPAPPADDPASAAEHDRVGRRPQRRAATTAPCASTGSRPTRRSSGRPRSRPGSTRTRRSARRSRSGTRAGAGDPRQPDRRAGGRFAALPPAGLPPVDLVGVPGVPADRGREPDDGGLGRDARARPSRLLLRRRRAGPRRRRAPSPDAAPPRPPTPPPAPTPTRRARSTGCRPTSPAWSSTRTRHFELAQAALRDGDFATYGTEIAQGRGRAPALGWADRVAGAEPRAVTAGVRRGGARWRPRTAGSPRAAAVLPGGGRGHPGAAGRRGRSGSSASSPAAASPWWPGPIVVLPTPTGLQNALGGR